MFIGYCQQGFPQPNEGLKLASLPVLLLTSLLYEIYWIPDTTIDCIAAYVQSGPELLASLMKMSKTFCWKQIIPLLRYIVIFQHVENILLY